jgi:hypothetical protein
MDGQGVSWMLAWLLGAGPLCLLAMALLPRRVATTCTGRISKWLND